MIDLLVGLIGLFFAYLLFRIVFGKIDDDR